MESDIAIEALGALAHPSRLTAFRLLVQAGEEGLPAGEIARRVKTPANTMSTQLAILTRARLIHSRRESRSVIYAADYTAISGLIGFLMEDCCGGRAEVCAPLNALTTAACRTPAKEMTQ